MTQLLPFLVRRRHWFLPLDGLLALAALLVPTSAHAACGVTDPGACMDGAIYSGFYALAQWRTRAAMSGVLLAVGVVLLRAANNDHWSATMGLALGQVAIGAGAWSIARPILSVALAAVEVPQQLALLPSLMLVVYTFGLVVWSGPLTIERALVAAYLTAPGFLLDTLLRWYEGQERPTAAPPTAPKEHAHDHHRA